MQITTILPVSRVGYLDRVLQSLERQTTKPNRNIIIVDGSDEDFELIKSKVAGKNYELIRSTNRGPAFAIIERRQHIANIHNQAKELIGDDEWVFSIEDDGILPYDALERLLWVQKARPEAGMLTGVELGRWGVPYVGAWRADDVHRPKQLMSMENHAGEDFIDHIDAAGLYCALIRGDLYRSHHFNSDNGLGPDVNLGLDIRCKGNDIYIAWAVPITHLTNRIGLEIEIPATDYSQIVTLTALGNNTWQQIKYGQKPFGVL